MLSSATLGWAWQWGAGVVQGPSGSEFQGLLRVPGVLVWPSVELWAGPFGLRLRESQGRAWPIGWRGSSGGLFGLPKARGEGTRGHSTVEWICANQLAAKPSLPAWHPAWGRPQGHLGSFPGPQPPLRGLHCCAEHASGRPSGLGIRRVPSTRAETAASLVPA